MSPSRPCCNRSRCRSNEERATIEEANAACFIVKDHKGQALAYVYFLKGAHP